MVTEHQLSAAQDAISLLKERLATVQDKYNCILVRFSEITESNNSAAQERLAGKKRADRDEARLAALQRTNDQQAANIEQLYEANRELVKQMERKAARLAEGVCSTPEDVIPHAMHPWYRALTSDRRKH